MHGCALGTTQHTGTALPNCTELRTLKSFDAHHSGSDRTKRSCRKPVRHNMRDIKEVCFSKP